MKPLIFSLEKMLFLLLLPAFVRIDALGRRQRRQTQFLLWSEFMSLLPFQLGSLARRVFYRQTLKKCGANPVIRMGAIFIHPGTEIGDDVFIGNRCAIGLASIGDNVMLAPGVSVLSGRYHHGINETDVPPRLRQGTLKRVRIGNNVWVGSNAVIMDDVGDSAVIGAGAVVVRSIPGGATAAGSPARAVISSV